MIGMIVSGVATIPDALQQSQIGEFPTIGSYLTVTPQHPEKGDSHYS
jgi:hypothetical protein